MPGAENGVTERAETWRRWGCCDRQGGEHSRRKKQPLPRATWCWRRLLRVPGTARRPNQSSLKEISPGWSLEGLMLKPQYFGHLMWPKSQLIGKHPDAGKDWGQEKGVTEDEMAGLDHGLNGHEFEQAPGDSEGQGSLGCCSPRGHPEWDKTEWLNSKNNYQWQSDGMGQSQERGEWTEWDREVEGHFLQSFRGHSFF